MSAPRSPRLLALALLSAPTSGCADDGPRPGTTAADTTGAATTATTSTATTADLTSTAAASTTGATTGAPPGSSGATADPGTAGPTSTGPASTGPVPEDCIEEGLGGPFVVADGAPSFAFELPMTPDVDYRRLEVRFAFDPVDWGGECYNPYYQPPKLVPVFHQMLTLRRGAHWCKGGNLGEFALTGPGKDKLTAEVYHKDPPWEGSGCGPEVEPFAIFGAAKTVVPTPGQMNQVELVYDAGAATIEMAIAGQMFTGAPHPDASLRAFAGHPLFLVFSNSESNECYDAEGNMSDAATCCHAPSWGWVFDAIEYRLCK